MNLKLPDYFTPYDDYVWQWEDYISVLAIPGGNTIAYNEFVLDALEVLQHQSVPPFGALLMVIAATNTEGGQSVNSIEEILEDIHTSDNSLYRDIRSPLEFLQRLTKLPDHYKREENRMLLFKTIFEKCHNHYSLAASKKIVRLFKEACDSGNAEIPPSGHLMAAFVKDCAVLVHCARKFPNNTVLIKAMSGLVAVDEELKIEEEETEGAAPKEKDFIDTLADDIHTFYSASLVKRLWSGLNIPYHHHLPSQQPLGGVSDLTNKGEFDRLLISEFAHDHLVFLSRLANNEALYINREVPPQPNSFKRIFLIDVSLKNWGTPKTIAHSLLLAIAKHPKTDIPCLAFAVGDEVEPLNFETIDGVTEGMKVLSNSLHAGAGLEKFFAQYGREKDCEIFFISAGDAYRHPALHKTISDHYHSFNYWIHTDDKGGIDLYKRQQNSRKHVQHLQLPLDEIWKKAPKPKNGVAERNAPSENFPILFAPFSPMKKLMAQNGDIFLITSQFNLLRLADPNRFSKGWQLMSMGLPPFYGDAEIGVLEDGSIHLLMVNNAEKELTILDVRKHISITTDFFTGIFSNEPGFFFYQDAFFCRDTDSMHYRKFAFLRENDGWKIRHSKVTALSESFPGRQNRKLERAKAPLVIPGLRSYKKLEGVEEVFINQAGNLVFDSYELILINETVIKFEKTSFLSKNVKAVRQPEGEFKFDDGSTVIIHYAGVVILSSSDPKLDKIYVPADLNNPLGVATLEAFTGVEYFHNGWRKDQDMLSPKKFWKMYIYKFLNIILSHDSARYQAS